MIEARDLRHQRLRGELVARLERVRGQLTNVEFDDLVVSVERTAARFAEIEARPFKAWGAPATRADHADSRSPPGS